MSEATRRTALLTYEAVSFSCVCVWLSSAPDGGGAAPGAPACRLRGRRCHPAPDSQGVPRVPACAPEPHDRSSSGRETPRGAPLKCSVHPPCRDNFSAYIDDRSLSVMMADQQGLFSCHEHSFLQFLVADCSMSPAFLEPSPEHFEYILRV